MASGMNACLAFMRLWAQPLHCKIKTSGFFVLTGKLREMTFRDFWVHQTHGVLCFALPLCFEIFVCVWMCSCVAIWRPEVNLWCPPGRTIQLFKLVSLTGTWGLLIWLAWLFGGTSDLCVFILRSTKFTWVLVIKLRFAIPWP